MKNDRGKTVDADTRSTLDAIEGKLEKLIRTLISEGFKEVKGIISELFDKDIKHINENLARHDKYHDEHYKADQKFEQKLTDLRASLSTELEAKIIPITEELEDLKEFQIESKVVLNTQEKIEEKDDRKKELSYGKVGALVALASLISGGVVFLINYL